VSETQLQALLLERDNVKALLEDDDLYCWGRVALWGRVIECENGCRAQYGYPQELFLISNDKTLGSALANAYGVPVRQIRESAVKGDNHEG